MAAGAVVDLLKAAAEASSETVSHGLVRLFTKLAVHADSGSTATRPLADSALREQVHSLLADWNLADPEPDRVPGHAAGDVEVGPRRRALATTRNCCSSRCRSCRWRWSSTKTARASGAR